MIKFEIVTEYKGKDINLPKRSTKGSAGYDIEAAETMIIPSYLNVLRRSHNFFYSYYNQSLKRWQRISNYFTDDEGSTLKELNEVKKIVKENNLRTMVPTGLKAKMPENVVLKIHPRSGLGSNNFLVLANQTGIIDSDYYNNPDNEGHIFIPILNLSPYDVEIKKGDKIAQGIFEYYLITDDDNSEAERVGGFGSTDTVDEENIQLDKIRCEGTI